MTDAEIYEGLTQLFQEMFADDDIVLTPATTANDIEGWDSFNHLNLIVAMETRFAIRLHTADIETLTSVGDLAALIRAKKEG